MKRNLLTVTLAMCLAMSLSAQETPMWIRRNAISPDGSSIAFSYKGDIYTVPAKGGKATQLTTNSAYDSAPMWTADSKSIIFVSVREGSPDIYITSAEGGSPKRITDYPGTEKPLAVLPDGNIMISAYIQPDAKYGGFPGTNQTYIISQNGGRPKLFSSLQTDNVSVNADGTIIYEDYKGYEDPFRKHHTSLSPGTYGHIKTESSRNSPPTPAKTETLYSLPTAIHSITSAKRTARISTSSAAACPPRSRRPSLPSKKRTRYDTSR